MWKCKFSLEFVAFLIEFNPLFFVFITSVLFPLFPFQLDWLMQNVLTFIANIFIPSPYCLVIDWKL